ncbi:MAG: hypothetical protein ACREUE_10430 [Panacagrimonas sp.]
MLAGVLTGLPLYAQDRAATEPREAAETAPGPSTPPQKPPEKPAPPAASSTREFKPSEEVSPDQEVDFPADL